MTRDNVHCAPIPDDAAAGDECDECGALCLEVTIERAPYGRVETWKRGPADAK